MTRQMAGRFNDYFTSCGIEVFVAPGLADDREIAFNAGTHTELVKMAYADFDRLVHPKVVSCTT